MKNNILTKVCLGSLVLFAIFQLVLVIYALTLPNNYNILHLFAIGAIIVFLVLAYLIGSLIDYLCRKSIN